MLMNPQQPPCYTDMYNRGVNCSYNVHNAVAAASSQRAASVGQLPLPYPQHNNNHEFYSNSQQPRHCYDSSSTPPLPHIDPRLSMERPVVPHNYYSTGMPTMDSLNLYPSQSWSYSTPDDKRGPVIMGQPPPIPPAKRKGGRKPKDDPNLPPVEKEKRRLRRLRNKEAAAKCRERRLNHTSSLLQQIEQLEKSQKSYEDKISQLRQHKDQCEKLLTSHNQDCNKTLSNKSPATASTAPSQSSTAASSPVSTAGMSTPSPPVSSLHVSSQSTSNRRKQTAPRLKIDVSCADSHRRTSSSSSGGLQSPSVIH